MASPRGRRLYAERAEWSIERVKSAWIGHRHDLGLRCLIILEGRDCDFALQEVDLLKTGDLNKIEVERDLDSAIVIT